MKCVLSLETTHGSTSVIACVFFLLTTTRVIACVFFSHTTYGSTSVIACVFFLVTTTSHFACVFFSYTTYGSTGVIPCVFFLVTTTRVILHVCSFHIPPMDPPVSLKCVLFSTTAVGYKQSGHRTNQQPLWASRRPDPRLLGVVGSGCMDDSDVLREGDPREVCSVN